MKKYLVLIAGVCCLLLTQPMIASAGNIQMEDIDQVLEELIPEERISFEELVTALLSEDEKLEVALVGGYIRDNFFYILRMNKSTIIYLVGLAVIAAMVTNFASVFQNKQVAETGFYMIYMIIVTVCLQTFVNVFDMVEESIRNLILFMKVLSPVYFLSMSLSTGKISAVGFYSLLLVLLYLVELVILNGLLPMSHVYLMSRIMNFLSKEGYFSKLSDLTKLLVNWGLKTLIAAVSGVGMLQGLLSPHADALKRGTVAKVINLFPGIGDALGIAGEMMIHTAVFLKNGIGMAGCVILVFLCLIPLINIGTLVIVYKGIAAMIQPVSDKRIVELLGSVGETYGMLLKIIAAVLFLFLISIGLTASFTS